MVTDHCGQPTLPGFDSCLPVMPEFSYVAPWHPIGAAAYGGSPHILGAMSPGPVGYIASPPSPTHFVPRNM